jgi:hypothetical protein
MKMTEFMNQSNLSETLIGAVVDQFGGWESFVDSAEDVTNHGIDGGFGGFIYYNETVKFTEDNLDAILDMAKEMAESMGDNNIFTMIASFNCVNESAEEVAEAIYNKDSEERTQIFNALAWFAGEEVCRSYCDILEN